MEQYINKIINADCMDFLPKIPDKSIDCIFTDVPYKQEFNGRGMGKDRIMYTRIKNYGGTPEQKYSEYFELCIKKLKTINFFTFCNKETKYDFIKLAKEHNFSFQELCFCKTSPVPLTNNQWLPDVEYGIHIFKSLEVMGSYKTKRSFWILDNFKEANINHPTAKKVSVCMDILKNITKEGQIVLDAFSGSGTTAIACLRLNRNFICIEKDNSYFEQSLERLKKEKMQKHLF